MDPVTVIVQVTATPEEGNPFSRTDLIEAVQATLHEVFPTADGWPIQPKVEAYGDEGRGYSVLSPEESTAILRGE